MWPARSQEPPEGRRVSPVALDDDLARLEFFDRAHGRGVCESCILRAGDVEFDCIPANLPGPANRSGDALAERIATDARICVSGGLAGARSGNRVRDGPEFRGDGLFAERLNRNLRISSASLRGLEKQVQDQTYCVHLLIRALPRVVLVFVVGIELHVFSHRQ